MRQNENQCEKSFMILFGFSLVFALFYLLCTGEVHRFLAAGILFGTFVSLSYLIFQSLKYKREWRLVRKYPKVLFYGQGTMVFHKKKYQGLLLLFDRSLLFLSPWEWHLGKKPFKTIKHDFPFSNVLEIQEEKRGDRNGTFFIKDRKGKVYFCFLKNKKEWLKLIQEKADKYNESLISDTDRRFKDLRPFSQSFGAFTEEQYERIRNFSQ